MTERSNVQSESTDRKKLLEKPIKNDKNASPSKIMLNWNAKKEERQSTENKHKYIIRVNDSRKTVWDLFIIVLALWNCVCIPL